MHSQRAIETLAGPVRLAPYLVAAQGDIAKASDLYLWAGHLSGALHSTISFVEIAVRNAIDAQLAQWNDAQPGQYGRDWALQDCTEPFLYDLIGPKRLKFARESAQKKSGRRPRNHPRRGAPVTNDDVVAQLMFGAWVNLIAPVGPGGANSSRQERLWNEAMHAAFPGADSQEQGRVKLGRQLERIRRLRNRVAHHDNLLSVQVNHRLNDMLAILQVVDERFPDLAMARSQVRAVLGEDPRRSWTP